MQIFIGRVKIATKNFCIIKDNENALKPFLESQISLSYEKHWGG